MRRLLSLGLLAVLAACGQGETERPAAPPLYVYASYSDVDYLPALFRAFTEETGIVVVVRHRSDAENLADMAAKSGTQPADLLITSSIGAIWQAADEGLLRPFPDASTAAAVPEAFRDPDNLWVALSIDPMVFIADDPALALDDYRDFARDVTPVCVSSSTLPANRALIASLIAEYGRRETELSVRRWMSELGLPPRDAYQDVASKVRDGSCRVGLLPRSALAASSETGLVLPARPYYDIEGVGIGRHASQPESAARLLDWLLGTDVQRRHADARHLVTVTHRDDAALRERLDPRGIAAAGFQYQEAILLAERARYR